jgi:4-alpha-glucanotransferase
MNLTSVPEKTAGRGSSAPWRGDNLAMQFQRASGVLLHISSLPSCGGIGDLGPAAHEFVAFLAAAKQHIWQVLPVCPTGFGNSPYAGSSAFAGNPFLISLEFLADWGWIETARIDALPGGGGAVDFGAVESRKLPLLYQAAGNFVDRAERDAKLAGQWQRFAEFCRTEENWLADYALYAHMRRIFRTGNWTEWPEPLRRRDPAALAAFTAEHGRALAQEQALQFAFSEQWNQLRDAAVRSGIRILGDVPIFINLDSSDVWVHPAIFELDETLRPVRVAGVPPDYFSVNGQRWGNPLYRWDVLKSRGFDWWVQRMRRARQLYDIVRLDHFRGFEAYWSIPASDETAVNGAWVKAPGGELFECLEASLGPIPLVAEDLGLITPEVDALRIRFGMPGMKVIQFGFDKGAHVHLPHRYTPGTIAYTGTHDNDTTEGWWKSTGEGERAAVAAYVGLVDESPTWHLIRAIENSVAQVALIPAQDLLLLGSEARMNTPAVADGNWAWRAPAGSWTPGLAARLAALVDVTDRDNDPLADRNEPAR